MSKKIEVIRQKWTNQKDSLENLRTQFRRLRNRLDEEDLTDDKKWEFRVLFSTILENTYSGFERIFEEIAQRIDNFEDSGKGWHKQLLESMTSDTPRREPVISSNKQDVVEELLRFRHLSRKRYPGELNWEELMEVLSDYEEYFEIVYEEIDDFVTNLEDKIYSGSRNSDRDEKTGEANDGSKGLDMDL